VRQVDADTHPVHLGDQRAAEAREAALALLEAAVAGRARLVVRELRHAQAERVEAGDARKARAERRDALPAHDEARAALALSGHDVVGGAHQAPTGIGRGDALVPRAHALERRRNVVEHVHDGDVRGGDAAVGERRGVAVAQVDEAVDDGRAVGGGRGHAGRPGVGGKVVPPRRRGASARHRGVAYGALYRIAIPRIANRYRRA
jgi:hypothetical protein